MVLTFASTEENLVEDLISAANRDKNRTDFNEKSATRKPFSAKTHKPMRLRDARAPAGAHCSLQRVILGG
jgi:hypothetical protein